MARTRPNPNILLVEGDEEKRVIPYLMDHHVVWGDKEDEWVVQVKSHGGIDDLLEPATSRRKRPHRAGKPSESLSMPMTTLIRGGHGSDTVVSRSLMTSRRFYHQKGSSIRTRRVCELVSGSCRTTNREACWKRS